jgi:methylmalonyl-CoA/ethylmalonyl-CoA epimerase
MLAHEQMVIAQIGQIAIPVQDLDRAVTFYRDMLRLPFLFQTSGLAFFQCGEVRLMLSLPESPDTPTRSSIIYYKVDDLPRAYAMLREQHAKLIDEPHHIAKMEDHDLWMAFCEDSEGNVVGLMSEVREA